MSIILFIIFAVASYFIGAIPFGLIYSLMRGVDIRTVGSKNIGSTNVSRQFGFLGGFVPVFILDFLKSALPVLTIRLIGVQGLDTDLAMVIIALSVIIGHIFPIYLGFKGGKGVASAAGAFFMFAPKIAASAIGVFIIVLFTARAITFFTTKDMEDKKAFFKNMQKNVGISSVLAAVSLPVFVLCFARQRIILLCIASLIAVLFVFTHRKNLVQLFKGTDNK